MELRHLCYFIAVAEQENVSRAALKLHVSQPALSKQIHDLEDELGFPLLERTAKSVHLTDAGKIFLTEAKAVITRVQEAVASARAVATGALGEIHIGYAPSLTVQILPQTLRAFQRDFPKCRVALHDLSTEQMLEQLGSGKLQAALMVKPARATMRGLAFEELARYPLCAAVRPDSALARSRSIPLTRIATEPLVVYNREDYPEYHEELRKLIKRPRIVEEHEGVNSLITSVESGRGVAIVPSCIRCLAGPRLKLIPLTPTNPIVVGAVWKTKTLIPMAEKFITAARSCRNVD